MCYLCPIHHTYHPVLNGNMLQLCQERWQAQSFTQRGSEPAKKIDARSFSVKRHTLQHTPHFFSLVCTVCSSSLLSSLLFNCSGRLQCRPQLPYIHQTSFCHSLAKGHTLKPSLQYYTLDWNTDTFALTRGEGVTCYSGRECQTD